MQDPAAAQLTFVTVAALGLRGVAENLSGPLPQWSDSGPLTTPAYERRGRKGACNYRVHPSAIQIQIINEQTSNKKTTFQIRHHSDDIKTYMFRNSDVRSFTHSECSLT